MYICTYVNTAYGILATKASGYLFHLFQEKREVCLPVVPLQL